MVCLVIAGLIEDSTRELHSVSGPITPHSAAKIRKNHMGLLHTAFFVTQPQHKHTWTVAEPGMPSGPLSLILAGSSPLLSPSSGTNTRGVSRTVMLVMFDPMSSLNLKAQHSTARHSIRDRERVDKQLQLA